VSGIDIHGVPIASESTDKYLKTAYVVKWEEVRMLFLGHLSHMPSDDMLDEFGEPDIIFVPTGDSHYIEGAEAAKLIKKLEPAVIIPAYYKSSSDLLKALGVKPEKPEEKFVFRKKDLATMKGKVVVLEANG
jgi:L-ascorbate metabolism protein UlaG (beta-lactamase superfamily)